VSSGFGISIRYIGFLPEIRKSRQRYHLPKNFGRSPEIGTNLPMTQIEISGDFDQNGSKVELQSIENEKFREILPKSWQISRRDSENLPIFEKGRW
jgi:hypothetical protein